MLPSLWLHSSSCLFLVALHGPFAALCDIYAPCHLLAVNGHDIYLSLLANLRSACQCERACTAVGEHQHAARLWRVSQCSSGKRTSSAAASASSSPPHMMTAAVVLGSYASVSSSSNISWKVSRVEVATTTLHRVRHPSHRSRKLIDSSFGAWSPRASLSHAANKGDVSQQCCNTLRTHPVV